MHGRIKMKDPADIAEAKRKEKVKKLEGYRKLTSAVLGLWKEKVVSSKAMLLTEQLLTVNPDYYTAWNYRRFMIVDLIENSPSELKAIMNKELWLTRECVQKHPKSYWVWNHRRWTCLLPQSETIQAGPEMTTDWQTELKLCSLFLDLDSRNFHCWDYRRWVVAQARLDPHSELDFTTQLINTNFSNYSAWHYRSKLLPQLYPANQGVNLEGASIQEPILLAEFDIVQSACFTEPDDQSAWLYQRWLMGRVQRPLTVQLQYGERNGSTVSLLLVFSHPVKVAANQPVHIGQEDISGCWSLVGSQRTLQPVMVGLSQTNSIYNTRGDCISLPQPIQFTLPIEGGVGQWTNEGQTLTDEMGDNMTAQLETCKELLELEPDSKWTLLASLYIMQALGREEYQQPIMDCLEQLTAVDPYRIQYYAALRSKAIFGEKVRTTMTSLMSNDQFVHNQSFSCCKAGLTYIPPCELLGAMHTMDLSDNSIKTIKGCDQLWFVHVLILDGNMLTSLDDELAALSKLECLSLRNN
eukprot:Ihof_evm1s347 gene=Ihof_evmTU1s347